MRHASSRPAQRAGERWLLNIGAVVGTLCLIFAALALVFGLKPLIFSSGSMGPAIPTGSLALAVPVSAEEVVPGEVVSVVSTSGTRVTHRVVSSSPAGLVLKGDANAVADLQPYAVDSVDRVVFSVPGLGYVASWFASPWMFLLAGLLCAYLLYVAFIRGAARGKDSDSGSGPGAARAGTRRRPWLGFGAIAAVLAVVIPLGAVSAVERTQAAFTSSASAVAGPIAALTLTPASGPLGCTNTGILLTSANVTWSAPAVLPAGARYAVRLKTGTTTYGYTDVPAGTTTASFGPGLNLLGLLTSGGAQAMPVKVFVVFTTDGLPVQATGSNIGWNTAEAVSPERTIVYHPGLLLARDFSCS